MSEMSSKQKDVTGSIVLSECNRREKLRSMARDSVTTRDVIVLVISCFGILASAVATLQYDLQPMVATMFIVVCLCSLFGQCTNQLKKRINALLELLDEKQDKAT